MYSPQIDFDVPLAEFSPTFESLESRVAAALGALVDLDHLPEPTAAERTRSQLAFTGEQALTEEDLAVPGVITHLSAMLNEYDKTVVKSAHQLRTYVTNKLIEETAANDPRVRLKALELLGKISDVGLFTDKTEITLRHRPTEELEQMLRERLTKVIEGEVVELPNA
jgi:hypothetical protein